MEKPCVPDWWTVLNELQEREEPLSEYVVVEALQQVRKSLPAEEPTEEIDAEIIAFALRESRLGEKTEWGTRYGPMFSSRTEDGHGEEWPGKPSITHGTISYWAKRAIEAPHPVFKARYANVAWDLATMAPGMKQDYKMAQLAIDSTVALSEGSYHKYETQVIQKLACALGLAHQINDRERIACTRDAMISYEERIAVDEKAGLWGFCFDYLVREGLGRPTDEQVTKIISQLEARLERLSDPEQTQVDPWKVEAAVSRLAEYYGRKDEKENVERVLLKLGSAFETACKDVQPGVAHAWLEHLHSVLVSYGLTHESARIAVRLRKLGPEVIASLKMVPVTTGIEKEKLDRYRDALLTGESEEVLNRLAVHFIPERDKVETQVRKYAEEHALIYLFPTAIKDYAGRTVARIGSMEDDLEGRVIHQMSQNMQFAGVFLREAMAEASSRGIVSTERIVEHLYKSPVFRDEYRALLEHGLHMYLEGDAVAAAHILVPQIESAIRTLLEKAERRVIKPARSGGGYDLRLLEELLRDEVTTDILGENFVFYLRILLTDRRGWNLRNSLCHGMLPAAEIGSAVADRVVHALLCLALVREKESDGTESSEKQE